jgi:hypothetical protein
MGHTGPAPLARFLYEADPAGPMALFFWVGSATWWVDPAHSHLEVPAGVAAGGGGIAVGKRIEGRARIG